VNNKTATAAAATAAAVVFTGTAGAVIYRHAVVDVQRATH